MRFFHVTKNLYICYIINKFNNKKRITMNLNFEYSITNLEDYPQDGNHIQCNCEILEDFEIRKGEDSYQYYDKNNVAKMYGAGGKTDKRWIAHLEQSANQSLKNIFYIKPTTTLENQLEHCYKMYKKSLILESKRIQEELEKLKNFENETQK